VDVLIDPKVLEGIARERGVGVDLIEKDWILGWLLYGVSVHAPYLVFTGGTALSKIYFPSTWRLSEDLDFSVPSEPIVINERIIEDIRTSVTQAENDGNVKLTIESFHQTSDPDKIGYVQCRIKYKGPIGNGRIKLDITRDPVIEVRKNPVLKVYRDYPNFLVSVKSLEEITASKLVAIVSRDKIRDYFDVWMLLKDKSIDIGKVKGILRVYMTFHKTKFAAENIIHPGIEKTLQPYWKREIERLVSLRDGITLDVMMKELGELLKEKSFTQMKIQDGYS